MTNITAVREKGHITLAVTGHAGYAKGGEPDIVCAAVSALSCAALGHLKKLGEIEYRQEPGDVWMRVKASEGAEAALQVILTGFRMLQMQYPRHIRMERGKGV